MFNNKGVARILESLFAVGIIFMALAISITFPTFSSFSSQTSLSRIGSQALIQLDSDGTLGANIDERNWIAIGQALDVIIPTGISFNLTVYDTNYYQINDQLIQNSNLFGNELVSVRYACASQNPNVRMYLIQLQLAKVQ
jgi:hypothetical protein